MRLLRSVCVACGVALLGLGVAAQRASSEPPAPVAAAPAGSTVTIGGVEVPADCPLARNEHPRLLFTRADVPGLRARIEDGLIADEFRLVKAALDDGLSRGADRARGAVTTLGLFYHLTGDRRYGEACKEWILAKGSFTTYPTLGLYGYDMVYDLLSPAERRQCEEKILEYVKRPYAYNSRLAFALGMYGSGLEDERVAETIGDLYRRVRARKDYLNEWAADRGGDGNSHAYIGQHEYVGVCSAFQAWKASTGEDLWEDFRWARDMASYYVYHFHPAELPASADQVRRIPTAHVGINCWGGSSFPEETGAENFCPIAAARWQDGLAQWWIRRVINGRKADYEVLYQFWGTLLWLDAGVPEIGPENFPPTRLFKTRGYLAARSDWSAEATLAHFHCGRFEGDGRNNADNNSFLIYRRGYLACDTGTRAVNNPEQGHMSDGRHHNRYFVQTIAHNSITVGADDVVGNGWTAVCGGQVSRPARDWLARWGVPATEQSLDEPDAGRMVGYETHPRYDYAAGDATRSYSPDCVSNFTRQFVALWPDRTRPETAAAEPSVFVVFDRVSAVDPRHPKRWYLHTMEEPANDGRETLDTAIHPEGHYLCEGRTFAATHRGAKLYSRTLLPKDAVLRKIGGPGHQFCVEGENYDMYPVWWEKVGTREFAERIGLGAWRIEVEPRDKRQHDVFLHVLQACDDGQEMVATEMVERDGAVTVRLSTAGGAWEVTFHQEGPVGGRLRLTENGRTLIDAPMADDVRDHYRHWKDDPRYGDWTGNPHYRAVVGDR